MNRRDIIAMARIEESFKQREREAQQEEEREYDPLEDCETVAEYMSRN